MQAWKYVYGILKYFEGLYIHMYVFISAKCLTRMC